MSNEHNTSNEHKKGMPEEPYFPVPCRLAPAFIGDKASLVDRLEAWVWYNAWRQGHNQGKLMQPMTDKLISEVLGQHRRNCPRIRKALLVRLSQVAPVLYFDNFGTSSDAPCDAGHDAGHDAGNGNNDAGHDAGHDALKPAPILGVSGGYDALNDALNDAGKGNHDAPCDAPCDAGHDAGNPLKPAPTLDIFAPQEDQEDQEGQEVSNTNQGESSSYYKSLSILSSSSSGVPPLAELKEPEAQHPNTQGLSLYLLDIDPNLYLANLAPSIPVRVDQILSLWKQCKLRIPSLVDATDSTVDHLTKVLEDPQEWIRWVAGLMYIGRNPDQFGKFAPNINKMRGHTNLIHEYAWKFWYFAPDDQNTLRIYKHGDLSVALTLDRRDYTLCLEVTGPGYPEDQIYSLSHKWAYHPPVKSEWTRARVDSDDYLMRAPKFF